MYIDIDRLYNDEDYKEMIKEAEKFICFILCELEYKTSHLCSVKFNKDSGIYKNKDEFIKILKDRFPKFEITFDMSLDLDEDNFNINVNWKDVTLCIMCNNNQSDLDYSCRKCRIGLCDTCKQIFTKEVEQLTKHFLFSCNKCKTSFKEMCTFCKRKIICYMISDKIKEKNISNENRTILTNYENYLYHQYINNTFKISWNDIPDNIKNLIGFPYNYLKKHFNYCHCNDNLHCYKIAKQKIKENYNIQHYSLFKEGGGKVLYCKECIIKYNNNFTPDDYNDCVM